MIWVILILLPVIVIAGILYYRSWGAVSFVHGTFWGAALNIIKIVMIDRAVDKIAGMEKDKAENFVRLQHLLRFALTGIVLVSAALLPNSIINIWGAAAGVLTFQAATFSLKVFPVKEENE